MEDNEYFEDLPSNSSVFEFDNMTDYNGSSTETLTPALVYCSTTSWQEFHQSYKSIHGGSSLVVCVFGSIANIINIIVLSRRSMISPTNAILTALASTDLLVMAEYIPFALHQYILTKRSFESRYSWGWAAFVLFHAHFGQVFHTISISLTLTLAVWRYIAVGYPQNNVVWCSMPRAKMAIGACLLFSFFLNIMSYINLTIIQTTKYNSTVYLVSFAFKDYTFLHTINFIAYSVILKLLPCLALTWLSFALIQELLIAARRRSALMKRPRNGRKADCDKQADRVTRMLLAILILFLVSEVPQGILGLLYILPGGQFEHCYANLGDIMDMLVLFNSAVNFVLYCSMSKLFRNTFKELFTPCTKAMSKNMRFWKSKPSSQIEPGMEIANAAHV